MVRRGARGDGFLHGEAPSERPTFRGCRGGRRDRYRISDHRCMFRVNGYGYGGYTHCGDVPDYASSNDDSHDEASSSSDDFGSQFISWRAARQGVGRVDSIKEAGGAGAVGWPGYYAMRRTSGKDAKECAGQHNLLGENERCMIVQDTSSVCNVVGGRGRSDHLPVPRVYETTLRAEREEESDGHVATAGRPDLLRPTMGGPCTWFMCNDQST